MANDVNAAMSVDNLLKRFEEIHNFIYANDGLSPQQALDEFIKILFIKVYDENNNLGQFSVSLEEYHQASSGKETELNHRVSSLFNKIQKEYSEIFDKDEKIKLSNKSLGFVVNKLQYVNLGKSSSDAKGLAFQKMLSSQEKGGRGQYFTPLPVVDFCVKMIDPKYGETIIDPCCGSGGFIFSAFNHILKNNPRATKVELLNKYIYGVDISKSIVRIARMKFLLNAGIDSNIHCHNSLEDIDSINLLFGNQDLIRDGFDVLLTNPPFGTAGKITDHSLLANFNLGYKWETKNGLMQKTNALSVGQPAEILFVERCLDLLREGGRMAIVLPNGHFENPSLDYLRYYIRSKAQILGVVKLPQETFIPYGTGVKTSLLFLEKHTLTSPKNYSLFFAKVDKLGYQGNKNGSPIYKKDNAGNLILENGCPTLDEDFSTVLEDYRNYKIHGSINTANSYSANSRDVIDRIDYDFLSPSYQELINKISNKSVRLGDIVDIPKKKSLKLKDKTLEVEYIELSDINSHSLEIINSTTCYVHELPSRASYELKAGDIITAVAGNSIGTKKHATALVSKEYEGAICSNGFRILRNPKVNPYYLLYYLRSDYFLKQITRYRTGAAIPNVSDTDLENVLVYIPSQEKVDKIGQSVQEALNLRKESTQILDKIAI